MSSESEGLGSLIFVGVVALAAWSSDWIPFRSEYSTYSVVCEAVSEEGHCTLKGEAPGPITTYRADKETKTVIYWQEGGAPWKYENCAVANALNWSCVSGNDYHQMVEGVLDGRKDKQAYPILVSKLEWWWVKFKRL